MAAPTLAVTYGRVSEAAVRNAQLANGFEHCARNGFGVRAVCAEQHGDELFATVARYEIERATARGTANRGGDVAQALVAGLMAIAIVVGLEVIDIDEHHGHGKPVARGLLPQPAHLLFERRAVQQAGEPVVHGHVREPAAIEERHAVRALERVAAAARR